MLVHQNVSVCVATSPRPLIKIDANRTGHEGHRPLNQAAPTSYVRHPRPNQVPQRHRSACRRPLCSRARPTRQDGAAGTRPLAQPLRVGPGAGQGKPGWRQLRPRRRPHQVRPPAVPADRRPRGQLPRGSWSLPPRTVRPKVSAVTSWCSRLRRSTIEKNARTVQVMRPRPKNAHKTPAAATAETPKSGLEITTVTVCRSSRTTTVFSHHPAPSFLPGQDRTGRAPACRRGLGAERLARRDIQRRYPHATESVHPMRPAGGPQPGVCAELV